MDDMYIGKLLDDRYEIIEKIGSGGMAVVYKARCHRLNRFVAIKILKSDLAQDADLRRRFHAESQAVAMLSHPNIVSVYDVNHTDNVDYIVMELIEGITLKQYINKKGILNWKEALHFITQIGKALEHAHSRGIIHRDIKPHNIMILKDGNVKVADFGIARLLTTQNTLTQEALGSVHYISPEQAKGSTVDTRSDIYSVGVVLYEMLTSRLPFEGDSPVSVAIQHISSIPLMPREINPDIPVGLEEITMHAMDPNLDTRYPSVTDLLYDLEDFRKNPSIQFGYLSIPSVAGGVDNTRAIPTGSIVSAVERAPRRSSGNGISRNRVKPEEYKKNRNKASTTTTLVGIFCIAVFLLGLVWFMWNYALKGWLSPEEESRIDVPNFIGSMVDNVINNSDYTAYYNFTVIEEEDANHEAGYILDQDPAPSRSVTVSEDGIDVTLTVSAGREIIYMPDLANDDYRDANTKLTSLGIDLDIEFLPVPHDDVTEGYIIEHKPVAGEQLVRGMTVYITYSTGPEIRTVPVPDLTNLTEEQAVSRLQSFDLTFEAMKEYDEVAPAGKVFFQDYEPGTKVNLKTKITFFVSLGPEPVIDDPVIDDPVIDDPSGGGTTDDPNIGGDETPDDGDGELGNGDAIEPNG